MQFLSPYKISHTIYNLNQKPQTRNNATRLYNSILTTNIHIFYISLFLSKSLQSNKSTSNISMVKKLSCFFLPTTKKTVIFLRAPYKNKLARLNILQTNHRFVISGVLSDSVKVNSNLLEFFKKINFSSFKIKHSKTYLQYSTTNIQNFNLHNYN